jgi:hypothetical protein
MEVRMSGNTHYRRNVLWFVLGMLTASAVGYRIPIPSKRNFDDERYAVHMRDRMIAQQQATNVPLADVLQEEMSQLNACRTEVRVLRAARQSSR